MPDKNDNGRSTTAHEHCYNGMLGLDKLSVRALGQLRHRRGPRQRQMPPAGTTSHHCGDDSQADNRGNEGGRANDVDRHGDHANFYFGDVDDRGHQ